MIKWSEADAWFLVQYQQHSMNLDFEGGFHKTWKEHLSKNTGSHSQEINMEAQTSRYSHFINRKKQLSMQKYFSATMLSVFRYSSLKNMLGNLTRKTQLRDCFSFSPRHCWESMGSKVWLNCQTCADALQSHAYRCPFSHRSQGEKGSLKNSKWLFLLNAH